LLDVAGPLFTDGDHPPMSVALAGSVIGVLSLAALWYAAHGVRRAVACLAGLRLLSAVTAVPAVFVDGVPAAIVAFAVAFVVLTVLGVALILPAKPSPAVAS
jgi:hypothetical protein